MRSFLGKIQLILTIRCDDASHLASDALDRPLAWYERWALRGHLLGCWSCRHFRNQIAFLRDAMKRIDSPANDSRLDALHLSDDAKARLKTLLIGKDHDG